MPFIEDWHFPIESSWLPCQNYITIYCCSVTQSCPTLCDTMDCSTPVFPVLRYLLNFAQTHAHWVNDASKQLIFCFPLFLLPSIFPGIRVFSSDSALQIRWPNYWSFSFSISPSNEYSGLVAFRMDWFDLLAVQGTLKSLLQYHNLKASILQHSASFVANRWRKREDSWEYPGQQGDQTSPS